MLGRPAVSHSVRAVLRPLPVRAVIERRSKVSDFTLLFRVAIEIFSGSQCTGDYEGRIDGGQLAIKRTAAGLHVEKVIVEPLVSRAVWFRTLRAIPKKAQRGKRSANRIVARNEATLDADRISSQSKSSWSDAARRSRPSAVRHQAILRIGFLQKIVKCKTLKFVKLFLGK